MRATKNILIIIAAILISINCFAETAPSPGVQITNHSNNTVFLFVVWPNYEIPSGLTDQERQEAHITIKPHSSVVVTNPFHYNALTYNVCTTFLTECSYNVEATNWKSFLEGKIRLQYNHKDLSEIRSMQYITVDHSQGSASDISLNKNGQQQDHFTITNNLDYQVGVISFDADKQLHMGEENVVLSISPRSSYTVNTAALEKMRGYHVVTASGSKPVGDIQITHADDNTYNIDFKPKGQHTHGDITVSERVYTDFPSQNDQ